jgi:DNA topoisomerase I
MATGRRGKAYTPLPEQQSARDAGLRYVTDDTPGISRRRTAHGFRYLTPEGRALRRRETLARIRSLAIPPAWEQVWICPREDGHVQAIGRDARGRKQYRYHARWREVRDATKYDRVAAFARALPRIRRRVSVDLALPGLPREKVLATLVRLLETTFMRVGNEEYARSNDSFGLTTLRERQVRVRGAKLRFEFRGKSGVEHRIEVTDPRLARVVRRMQDLPGEVLFRYLDEAGETRVVESADVNDYLKSAAGEDFTSKDFRTWAGSLLAARALKALGRCESASQAKRNIALAVEAVSKELGNTRAVCRKCYIHPRVIECYQSGALATRMRGRSDEAGLLAVLRKPHRVIRASRLVQTAWSRSKPHSRGTGLARLLQQSLVNP